MSTPSETKPAPPQRPGWVDRLLKLLSPENGAASEPAPAPAKVAEPAKIVRRTPAGDVYRL